MGDRVGIKDVAAAAEVSMKTVSRVVNQVSTVEPGLRQRVEEAIMSLGYVPNTMARALRTGAGSAIGVVVDSIADAFFSALVSAIEELALARGLAVIVCSTGFDAGRERDQLLRLASQQARGVVLAPVGVDHSFLAPYRSTLPVVAVDRPLPGFDSITVDDYGAARTLVGRLAAGGHRRIGLIGFDPRLPTACRRRAAYDDVLREHGVSPDACLVPEVGFGSDAARPALRALLALPEPPTALFLANARHAATVISAIHELGRTDLALVSFGDFSLADAVAPAVTCIDQDPYAMGALAFRRLTEHFDHPRLDPVDLVSPTRYVQRTSDGLGPKSSARAG